ncbi:MAG: adenosylcobinamide-GDP ribazoletransferase [Dongiaceae bacterium]
MPDPSPARAAAQLRVALGFLTRLPVGAAGSLAAASWAFPVAGIVVGLAAALAFRLALWLALPPAPAAILAVGVALLLTGALHEDGLADLADGFGGGRDRTAKLAIMRDSRIGSYGVLALVLSVLLRVAALASLPAPHGVTAALVAAHALSRAPLPAVMALLPPARRDGLSATAGRPGAGAAALAVLIGAAVALLALGPAAGVAAIAAVAVAAFCLAVLAQRQVGGQTGDVLGAVQQAGEAAVLLVAAAAV